MHNIRAAHETPDALLQAVVVDWDYECYMAPDDCVVRATGLDGNPTLACLSMVRLQPWRLLPAAGILDVLDWTGMAGFSTPIAEAPTFGKALGR